MTNRKFTYLISLLVICALALVFFVMRSLPVKSHSSQNINGMYFISRVIDGDTIVLSNGEHVRLIGIDTPESRYNDKLMRDATRSKKDMNAIINMGKQASDFTRRLARGKRARLEFDIQERDRYGRLLAYVYLDDGTFLNAKIIEEGYAQIMTIPPNVKYSDLFVKLQSEARKNGKGLWKETADKNLF